MSKCSRSIAKMNTNTLPTNRENKYKRVGGLLVLFCVLLIGLDPPLTILGIVRAFNLLNPYFGDTPELLVLWGFVTVINSILISSGIFAGLSLLRKRLYAVSFTKKYLIACLISATA